MNGLAFFDTNVLLYADDVDAPAKRALAIKLIEQHQRSRQFVISLQVMQEYYAIATRKLGMSAPAAQAKVQLYAAGLVIKFVEDDVIAAIELHRLSRISFWDAMIVHAARLAGGAGVVFGRLAARRGSGRSSRRKPVRLIE